MGMPVIVNVNINIEVMQIGIGQLSLVAKVMSYVLTVLVDLHHLRISFSLSLHSFYLCFSALEGICPASATTRYEPSW